MPARRRIVPDASVVVPAFFPEVMQIGRNSFDLSKRARPLADAILKRAVTAIAPEHLIYEFTQAAHRKRGEGIEPEQLTRQLDDFLYLWDQGVVTEPMSTLASSAWRLSVEHGIPPPDSWYLACALKHEAELWVSHRSRDGFADSAKKLHGKVFVLTERRFDQA